MTDLFIKILNMSISASWLVLAVLLLRLLLKKAPKWLHVVLWGIVGLRLLCPFSIESALSLIPSAETVSPAIMLDATPTIHSGVASIDRVVNPVITESFASAELASANPLQIWIPVYSVLWLVGIAAMLLYTAVSYLRLCRRVRTAVRLRDNIYQSENAASPFVLGMVRPKIYLPFGISEQNTAHVIAHEEAHLARRDHLIKPIGFLLLTVYWFNPVLWVAYILLCRDIELACDERVIAQLGTEARADYSEALLACSVSRRMISACPLAFGEVGVKARVKNVLHYKKPAFWLILLAVIASIAVAVCFLTDPLQPTANDVETQNGYRITKMETKQELSVTIPKSALPDAIFTEERHTFPKQEIILYQNDTTTVYLSEVYTQSITNISAEERPLVFVFEFVYRDIDKGSVISTISTPKIENGVTHVYSTSLGMVSRDVADSATVYSRAAQLGGSGQGKYFLVYIDRNVVAAASDFLSFSVRGFTDIFYEKGKPNHEDDIPVIEGGVMGQADVKSPDPTVEIPADENKITVQSPDYIPKAVIDYATEYVQAVIDSYNREGKDITGTTIVKISSVNTGTAGLTTSIEMYALEYALQKQPEPIQVSDTYLLLFCTWGDGERSYERIGTITETEIQTTYATPEMLDRYGNAYTAAAADIGGAYRSQKYRTWLNTQQEK